MILILTYHRIVPDGQRDEFYDVTRTDFQSQLKLLKQSSLQALTPESLKNPQKDAHGFILTFDDGTSDHKEFVLPLVQEFEFRAVFFVPTAKLNRPGYLTPEAAATLAQAGNVLGYHGHDHRRMDTLGEEDMRVQFEAARNTFKQLGASAPWLFAPPGGFMNDRLQKIALEQNVTTIRSMRWGYNRQPDPLSLQCVPLNRHMTAAAFHRLLAFRRLPPVYAAKQAAKTLLPAALYERVRDLSFRMLRHN